MTSKGNPKLKTIAFDECLNARSLSGHEVPEDDETCDGHEEGFYNYGKRPPTGCLETNIYIRIKKEHELLISMLPTFLIRTNTCCP